MELSKLRAVSSAGFEGVTDKAHILRRRSDEDIALG
jgi:hypothetical protein